MHRWYIRRFTVHRQIWPGYRLLQNNSNVTSDNREGFRSMLGPHCLSQQWALVFWWWWEDLVEMLLPGSIYNEFCQASSEQHVATEPNLGRGKAHLSSRDDKPEAIKKQIAQLPHCDALRGSWLRVGNRNATDAWWYTWKRRRRRELSNALIYADGAAGATNCTATAAVLRTSTWQSKIVINKWIQIFKKHFCVFWCQALGNQL